MPQSQGVSFRIGGIDIVISAPSSTTVRFTNPLYQPFLSRCADPAPNDRMSVRLIGDGWPAMQGWKKVFDTGDSWKLYRDGTSNRLRLDRPGSDEPLWIAQFDRDVKQVDLYCRFGPLDVHGCRTIDLPLTYPLDQLLMMIYFAQRRGILVHGAGMVDQDRAYLFAGVSGAGKSTLSELMVNANAGRMLSDERVIVREVNGMIMAFGTPWAGTAGVAADGNAPLAGVFFLKHGKTNRIEKLDTAAAADRLLPVTSIPWYDPDTTASIIAFAKDLATIVRAYEMSFTPDKSAVDSFRNFM